MSLGDVSAELKYMEIIGRNKILVPLENNNFELAEEGVAELIESNAKLLRAINQLENAGV